MACRTCRARKIKCDRIRPVCQNCKLRSIPCTYLGERRTRQQTDAGTQRPRSANSRHQLEDVDDLQNYHASTTPDVAPPPISMSENEGRLDLWRPGQNATANQSIPSGNMPLFPGVNGAAVQGFFAQSPNDPDAAVQSPIGSRPNHPGTLLDRILRGDDAECLEVRNPALWMRATDGDEYTGPSSGISPISDLGLKWIRNHVPDSDRLCKTVQDIRDGFLSHLRQPKWKPHISLLTPRVSSNLRHIPPSRVMTYVEAYFSTVQTIFPILDQENFEAQLTLLGTDPDDELPSWKALLNAVMASGCRAALSEETAEAFQESGRESWGYFQNALSCETAIVHGATDLMAVQALAVMTIYAQGLSSPQRLEYTLCSIAYRLAQSLGLNCRPQPGWNLSEGEIQERSRVFWVIYCLDKTIALRCGRPQMIDDDEIGCCFPSAVRISRSAETSLNFAEKGRPFNFFLCFTRLSRICGTISRRLYSATALYSSSTQLLSIQNHLLENLESWRQMIPTEIQPGKPVRRNLNTLGLSRMQLVVLHSSYYYVLCAICRRFTPLFTDHEENAQRIIPPETHTIYIEAARSMVLLTKHLDVESFTPGWLAFYYPLTALIAIFVNVVSNPCSQSTHNDIALMEVIVGFFGRLEYITSGEAAFTKMTEFVRQARIVADNAASAHSTTKSQEPQRNCSPTSAPLAEDCIDAGETALVLMDAGNTQGPHTLSSQLLNNYAQPTIPSQEIESLNTYNLENVSTNYGLEIANEDPSSHLPYDDTVGLGELAHEHWLESSMPMSF